MPFIILIIKRVFYLVCSLSALVFISHSAEAEAVAWGGQWQTLSSHHFDIHYPLPLRSQAHRALALAEQVHTELLPFFRQAPANKTQLVLVDDYDVANGWATPMPFNQIRLYLHAPDAVDGLEQLDDWLYGLIRHEYVHILQMDMARGVPKVGRSIFGRFPLLFPHMLTPPMLIEGLAVYLETNSELGYGRLASSSYAMQMRTEIQAHGGDALDQVVAAQRDWPVGKYYLYGAYFWQFIAERYGEEAIQQYLWSYSGELLPYVMQNARARSVFGKSFPQLWQEYLVWLQQQFLQAPTKTAESFIYPSIPNTQQITAVQQSNEVSKLWQVQANGEDRNVLQFWQEETLNQTVLFKENVQTHTKAVASLDVLPTGEAVVSRLIPRKTGAAYNDVFLWSKQAGWKRLTHQQRFNQVRWQDEQHILAVRQIAGRSELWRIDRTGKRTLLWQSEHDIMGSFAVHPNGKIIVASIKRAQQGWNLEQFDLDRHLWQPLTQTKAIEHQPEFMPDGRLLFSADYGGVFNIYRLALEQPEQLEQLTEVSTGAFQPRWLNGRLVFQQYSSEGYEITQQDDLTAVERNLNELSGGYSYPNRQSVQRNELETPKRYRPWKTLQPTSWMPYITGDEDATFIGAQVSGQDALGRHNYVLNAGFSSEHSLGEGMLQYQYDNRYQLVYVRDHQFLYLHPIAEPVIISRNKIAAARHHVWNAFEDQLQLHLGISHESHYLENLPKQLLMTSDFPKETLVGAAFTFDNQEYYRNVAGVGWGTLTRLVYESFDVLENKNSAGDKFGGYRLQGSMQHTFDLVGRSTVAVSAMGGYSNQQYAPFWLGGSSVKDEQLLFSRSEFSLPGYKSGIQYGSRFYQGEVNYQAWLMRIERNLGLWPVGLGDVSAKLWLKNASAWQQQDSVESLSAVGAELHTELILGYQMLVPLVFGVAQGMDKEIGETQAYVRLGLVF